MVTVATRLPIFTGHRVFTLQVEQVAEYLVRSLDEEEGYGNREERIGEAERRYQEYKEGKVKTKSTELAFKEVRSTFK